MIDPRSHTAHKLRDQQSVCFAGRDILLLILLVICTAAALKLVSELFRDFASQELLEVL